MTTLIDAGLVADHNAKLASQLEADYDALGGMLARRGQDIEALTALAQRFAVAVPSWGVGTGGTRFARFPGRGEPRNVFEKLDDCAGRVAALPVGQTDGCERAAPEGGQFGTGI